MNSAAHQQEEEIAKAIIRIGLSKAADALSFFVNEQVSAQLMDLMIDQGEPRPHTVDSAGAKMHVLSTELRGAITGTAYLLFDEDEVARLKAAQPLADIDDGPLMLEVANILTAMVITQFANILDRTMYGYVPALKVMDSALVPTAIAAAHSTERNALCFTASFVTRSVRIAPQFVWFMEPAFLQAIGQVAEDEARLAMVRSLHDAA